jgi:hypothetical protein
MHKYEDLRVYQRALDLTALVSTARTRLCRFASTT